MRIVSWSQTNKKKGNRFHKKQGNDSWLKTRAFVCWGHQDRKRKSQLWRYCLWKKNKTKKIYQWLTSSQSEARYRKIQCPITVHNMANRPAAGLYLHNQEPYTQNKAGIIFSITQQTIVSMSLRKDIIFPPNDWTSMWHKDLLLCKTMNHLNSSRKTNDFHKMWMKWGD